MIHFADDKMENWRHWGISKATDKISSEAGIGIKTPQIQADIIFCLTVLSSVLNSISFNLSYIEIY